MRLRADLAQMFLVKTSPWAARMAMVGGLLALLACPSDDKPKPDATKAAPEAAATPPEPTPAPPPPEPEPMAVTLLHPGADDRQNFAGAELKTGEPQTLMVRVKLIDRTRRRLESPPISRFRVKSTVQSASDEGRVRDFALVDTFIPSVPRDPSLPPDEDEEPERTPEEAKEWAEKVDGFIDATKTIIGRIKQVPTDEHHAATVVFAPVEGDDPNARSLAAAVLHGLDHLSVAVPDEPIGLGAKWTTTRDVSFFGVPAKQTLEYSLRKFSGDQLEVRADVRYVFSEAPHHDLPSTLVKVTGGEADAKLTGRFDYRTGKPIEMHLRGSGKFAGEGPAGPVKPRTIAFDLRVDEDYLATPDPRVSLQGKFTQGGLVVGKIDPEGKVWFNHRRVKLSDEGDFLIGFGRDNAVRAIFSLQVPDSPPERHVIHVEPRTFEPEVIDGLPNDMVDLDGPTRKALARSRVRIHRVRHRVNKTPYFKSGFSWPMRGRVTSSYGRRRILNGVDKGYHWGVDLAAPVGRKVKAPAAGKVVLAESDVPLSGNLLILDHGHGLTSSLLHLEKILVEVDDEVEAGQVVALSGNTGRSTGPHLDWRMNLFDLRIDPQMLVSGKPR